LDQLFDFIHLGHEIPEALREASKTLAESTNVPSDGAEQLPVYNSSAPALAGTAIAEDEEMDMDMEALDTRKEEVEQSPVAVSAFSQYDPRVPSETDPPNAVYRIKLVCTLLEPSAKYLITPKSLPRVKLFLADFQRYLFTKPMLPVEVEFALLDTFDAVESQWRRLVKTTKEDEKENQFPRYQSWLEAHNATVAAEEANAVLEKKKRTHLEAVGDPTNALVNFENLEHQELYDGSQDGSHMEEEEDDGEDVFDSNSMQTDHDHDEEGEEELSNASEDDSQQGSQMNEEDGSHSESFADDDEDDVDEEEDEEVFDEEAYMRQLEEEAFERELRRATVEALEKGKNAARKIVADDMISGSQILKKKSTDRPSTQSETPSANPPGMFALSGQAGIGFQLLKRGNKGKVEAKEFVVPTDTNLALVASRNDDAAARERDEIKQRVLQYEAESAEAELTGGNVYLEQEKLQVIRNKPLSMDDIDRNFGTTRGDLAAAGKTDRPRPPSGHTGGRGRTGRGRGGGGRGRSSSGRTLFG
jgi:regulator of nonsense transcripts 2